MNYAKDDGNDGAVIMIWYDDSREGRKSEKFGW